MNAVILILAIAAMTGIGFVAVFAVLLIGMRTEGRRLSPSCASHTRTESVARRIVGLHVRRELEKTPVQYEVRR
jgi:hypothetical protein